MKKQRNMTAAALLLAGCVLCASCASRSGGEPVGAAAAAAGGVAAAPGTTSPAEGKPAARVQALAAAAQAPAGMLLAAENADLALFYSAETTAVAVLDKRGGGLWTSNPADRERDPAADAYAKGKLGSQLALTYFNKLGQPVSLDNFNDSINAGQFTVSKTERGVKFVYTIGDLTKLAAPQQIDRGTFEREVLPKAKDEQQRSDLERRYHLDEKLDAYVQWANNNASVQKRLLDIFAAIGVSPEALEAAGKGGKSAAEEKPIFTVPLEYELEETGLQVKVSMAELKKPESLPLQTIAVLDYFGAAGAGEEGYMFVPDGSGALIRLNNGKTNEQPYLAPVYGADEAKREYIRSQKAEKVRLPVFGMKLANRAMLAVIEDGAAIASIAADVGGRQHSYNHVGASFEVTARDELSVDASYANQTMALYQRPMHQGDLTIRYSFLRGDNADYAGMAAAYRDYLRDRNALIRLEPSSETPFYLDLLGAVNKRHTFLGIPYDSLAPLTTFAQAGTIANDLLQRGVRQVKLRLSAWQSDGIRQGGASRLSAADVLGGKKRLLDLAANLRRSNVSLYPDIATQHVYDNGSFSPRSDAARFLDRKPVKLLPFNPATQRRDHDAAAYYALSPAKLARTTDGLIAAYRSFGLQGLSLRDMGDALAADYRDGRQIDREQAADLVAKETERLHEAFGDTMIAGGNAYALPYARHLVQAPLTSSQFGIEDEEVPFYPMVVHGYIDYAGTPANLADDQNGRVYLLHALEYGANLSYEWTYAASSAVKETELNGLFALHYGDWIAEAASLYAELNRAQAGVRHLIMTGHDRLADGVFRTRYENGAYVIVNYNDRPTTVDGITVAALGYATGGGAR
ncbi:MAG: hypothetical protein J7639_00690 [Paenibacillaceae bacterium]|nr:hypothetical protein [Paenibacillaceae bacterium]